MFKSIYKVGNFCKEIYKFLGYKGIIAIVIPYIAGYMGMTGMTQLNLDKQPVQIFSEESDLENIVKRFEVTDVFREEKGESN